ncbi:hypothetical protein LOD99_7822 [Oopsacas minuta]|uniref:Uncharacterized protein n=1 Tax=Oopsacas minuta TaxID=111878 RepID=A0AAV7JQZ2_9METZ|nr:hypothetical protein LOD99_7822 [Oopsacas minuta]
MSEAIDKVVNFCIRNQKLGCLGGYNPSLLTQELSLIQSEMLSCTECESILRDPQHVDNGYRCKECMMDGEKGKLDETKSRLIGKLSAKCPFEEDGCEWEGTVATFFNIQRTVKLSEYLVHIILMALILLKT